MKKLIAAVLMGASSITYACTTYTIVKPNGSIQVCTICQNVVTCM